MLSIECSIFRSLWPRRSTISYIPSFFSSFFFMCELSMDVSDSIKCIKWILFCVWCSVYHSSHSFWGGGKTDPFFLLEMIYIREKWIQMAKEGEDLNKLKFREKSKISRPKKEKNIAKQIPLHKLLHEICKHTHAAQREIDQINVCMCAKESIRQWLGWKMNEWSS